MYSLRMINNTVTVLKHSDLSFTSKPLDIFLILDVLKVMNF